MIHLEWLLNPVTVYALAAVGLSSSLVLFVGVKREMAKARAVAEGLHEAREQDQLLVHGLQAELESLRGSVRKLEAIPPAQARTTGMGINLTRRAQALRMHRRGEPVPSIAAALETPGNEIALLLKVNGLTGEAQKNPS
jgi:hypothetical protein